MQSAASKVVILGTGGTIAGTAASAQRPCRLPRGAARRRRTGGRRAGAGGLPLEAEQVAQVDSKDMTHRHLAALAQRVAHHLQRADVAGVVITHGTDTLEETAYFLHRVLAPAKPVVLTGGDATGHVAAGRRPAEPARCGDRWRMQPGARGVLAVIAGRVFAGAERAQGAHATGSTPSARATPGRWRVIEEGLLRRWRDWPAGEALGLAQVDARRQRAGRGWRSSPATPARRPPRRCAGRARCRRPRRRRHRQRHVHVELEAALERAAARRRGGARAARAARKA